jgi:hypothetical protein
MATDITFYDNYKAPLPAGSYRMVLQQTVNLQDEASRHYYRDQKFKILAPRYGIDADEIQAFFPPGGGIADYTNTLPHIVLGTRNLPWERQPGESGEPWLALLVVSEKDGLDGKVVYKTGTVADLAPHSTTEWSRTEGGAQILVPDFKRDEDTNTPVRLLDINLATFQKICPRRDDLPWLAHIRQVDTADKVPLEMVADGDFSVLVANRFPPLGANTVYLISLEGWMDLLNPSATTSQGMKRVRLITLADWKFVNDPKGHDTFGGLMQNLKENSSNFGITLRTTSGEAYVDNALKRGYVPLDYKPVDSTPTFGWYRGPLAPLRRPQLRKEVFERADTAMIFDKDKGMFDLSYASAWELGRLTALSSPAFVKGLRLFVDGCRNAAEFAREIAEFIKNHASSFTDPISGDSGFERVTVTKDLVEWIARLVLLYPVPFHYLVPHQSLLPSESLRFFYLDNNWVDALVDGAFSIAVRNVGEEQKALRDDLRKTLSKIVYQHRLRLQGQDPTWETDESYMEFPKSGFLLRSRIVTGWPGVEVTATTDATSDTLPKILRFDQIADGVLFCLVRGLIKDVTFREPREGLTFGVGTDGKTGTVDVKKAFLRSESPGVVRIKELGKTLDSSGSAQFASQMIRDPEVQSIKWELRTD